MPLHPPQRITAHLAGRAAAMAVLAACSAPMLAACAGAAPSVQLPAKAPVQKATAASKQRSLSPRQQVVAAYTGYAAAMAAAFDSRNSARVVRLLAPYLDDATVVNAARAFRQAWAKDEVSYGQVVRHIIGVRIQGTAAWVHDCDNTSGSGLEYARTSQIVPGSLGLPDENIVTRLNLMRGHWVVAVQTIEDVPCRP
jgi:hypothetical protein